MSEKLNVEQRQKYVEFRFEDSLRKYQQPPKKRPKFHETQIESMYRNNRKHEMVKKIKKNIRYGESNKIYNIRSRQKIKKYQKKSSIFLNQSIKLEQFVQDFNWNRYHLGFLKSNNQRGQQLFQENGGFSENVGISDRYQFFMKSQINNFQFAEKYTPQKKPFLFQFNHQHSNKSLNLCSSFDQQIQQIQRNKMIFKDIDFHIGLVESLNQKISIQIQKCQEIFNPNIHEQPSQSSKNLQLPSKTKLTPIEIPSEKQKLLKNQTQDIFKEQQTKKLQKDPMQQQMNQSIKRIQQQAQLQLQLAEHQQQKCKQQVTESKQNDRNEQKMASQRSGRIKIKGLNRQYFLSARVLDNLCINQKQPKKIIQHVISHHPQLKDACHYLMMLINQTIRY